MTCDISDVCRGVISKESSSLDRTCVINVVKIGGKMQQSGSIEMTLHSSELKDNSSLKIS